MSKQQTWLSAAAVACSYKICLTHSQPDTTLIDPLALTFAASIAIVRIPRWTVAACSAAHRVGACPFAVASAIVAQALVHVYTINMRCALIHVQGTINMRACRHQSVRPIGQGCPINNQMQRVAINKVIWKAYAPATGLSLSLYTSEKQP